MNADRRYVIEKTNAETIADVIRALADQTAKAEARADELDGALISVNAAKDKVAADLKAESLRAGRLYERATVAERELVRLTTIDQNRSDVTGRYDRITLDLWHYIVELSGHRDTAKTKAERIALGHVVERLKEIRGLNDAEREFFDGEVAS